MLVRHGDEYLGITGVMDTARPGVSTVVEELRALGVERMAMLSGDNQQVATAIAPRSGWRRHEAT